MQKAIPAIVKIQKAEILNFLYTIINGDLTAKNVSSDCGNNGASTNPFV